MNKLVLPSDTGDVSDGYYSFNELYERCGLLLCLTVYEDPQAWKSRKDSNGIGLPGWFIAGTDLDGYQVACYMPDHMWDCCKAEEVDEAEVDGVEIKEFCFRIRMYLEGSGYDSGRIGDPVVRK